VLKGRGRGSCRRGGGGRTQQSKAARASKHAPSTESRSQSSTRTCCSAAHPPLCTRRPRPHRIACSDSFLSWTAAERHPHSCPHGPPACVEGVCEWCVCERVGASAERPPAITLAGASLAIGLISIMIVARPDPPKTQPSGSTPGTPGTRWRCTPPRSRHEGLK